MRGEVQTWSFVALLNISNKLGICASKPARTQSPKTLKKSMQAHRQCKEQTTVQINNC